MNQKPHICVNFSRPEDWRNYLSRSEQWVMLSTILNLANEISRIMGLRADQTLIFSICPSVGRGNDGPFFDVHSIVLVSSFIHKGWVNPIREWRHPIGLSVTNPNRCWTGRLEHNLRNISKLVCQGLEGTLPLKSILASCGVNV